MLSGNCFLTFRIFNLGKFHILKNEKIWIFNQVEGEKVEPKKKTQSAWAKKFVAKFYDIVRQLMIEIKILLKS